MRKISTLVLFLFFCFKVASAQYIPNNYFNSPAVINCDSIPAATVDGFLEWEAYQTADDLWDGTRDSACFDYADPAAFGNACKILGDDVANKAVFVRSKFDTSNMVLLDTNNLYRVEAHFNNSNLLNLKYGTSCGNGLCSGFKIGIRIPDSTGTTTDMRWYEGMLDSLSPYMIEMCFATERFVNANHLREVYFKFSLDGNNTAQIIRPDHIFIENMDWQTLKFKDIKTTSFNGTSWDFWFNNWAFWENNFLLMYTASTYPTHDSISYVKVAPSPNTTTQETINCIVDFGQSLNHQPYTDMIGDTVVGDTIRHIVNLVNNGGTVCLPGFIDKKFENGNKYIHNAGTLSFTGRNACMLFGKGGAFVLGDNVTIHYGQPRMGMLALKTGAMLRIGRNSELIIHNKMVLQGYHDDPYEVEIHMDLDRGSTLRFANGARLVNNQGSSHKVKLYVHLKGGVLDDSGLSEMDKELIVRVYEKPQFELEGNVVIAGNPFDEKLFLGYTTKEEENISMELINLQGQRILKSTHQVREGINYIEMNTLEISAGIYLLSVHTEQGIVQRKVIKF